VVGGQNEMIAFIPHETSGSAWLTQAGTIVAIILLLGLAVIVAWLAARKHRNPCVWGIGALITAWGGSAMAIIALLCFHDLHQLTDLERNTSRRKEALVLLAILVLNILVYLAVVRYTNILVLIE
jgi:amino acid transporter